MLITLFIINIFEEDELKKESKVQKMHFTDIPMSVMFMR
jgi:hypothetical protein